MKFSCRVLKASNKSSRHSKFICEGSESMVWCGQEEGKTRYLRDLILLCNQRNFLYIKYSPSPSCMVSVVLMNSKPIVISDNDQDLDIDWWIQDLFLNQRDCEILQTGKELTDNISTAQTLLSEQYPTLKSFQNTCLGHHLDFKTILRCIPSVRILHTGLYIIAS